MAKFKVGDRVRFTDACDTYWFFGPHTKCKEGEISEVLRGRGYKYQVRVDGDGYPGYVNDEHIEPVGPKFKVGDRVVPSGKASADLVEHWNEYWSGEGEYEGAFYVTKIKHNGMIKYSNRPGGSGPYVEEYYMVHAPLKLEAGKFYRTRNGKRVGPLIAGRRPGLFGAQGYSLTSEWYDDGRRSRQEETDLDIIAEWVEEDNPTTPCIVALIENGQPAPSTRPRVHSSRRRAEAEAMRLARKHKGREFGVYELVVTKQETPEYEWQRAAAAGRKIEAIKKLREISGLSLAGARAAVEDFAA